MLPLSPSDWWSVGPVDLLLLGLATWRLTSLLVQEEGPWAIFARLRYKLGVRYDEHSEPYGLTILGALFACMWCASVWTGAIVSIAYATFPPIARLLSLPLALSTIALLLNRMVPHE
jgi:hypothetical protein